MNCRQTHFRILMSTACSVWTFLAVTSLVVGTQLTAASTFDNDDVVETNVASQLYPAEEETYGGNVDRVPENARRENIKKLLLLALLKLSKEAQEEKAVQEAAANDRAEAFEDQQQPLEERKRGRWQGFCFRKSRSGRIHPYICWKGSDI